MRIVSRNAQLIWTYCEPSRTLRRSIRSARTPPRNASRPNKNGELEMLSTSQLCARFCIHVPMLEVHAPIHINRKSRYWNALKTRRITVGANWIVSGSGAGPQLTDLHCFVAALRSVVEPDGAEHHQQDGGQNGDCAERGLRGDTFYHVELLSGKRSERRLAAGDFDRLVVEDAAHGGKHEVDGEHAGSPH